MQMAVMKLNRWLPLSITALWISSLIALWASSYFQMRTASIWLYAIAILLFGLIQLLSFAAAVAAGLNYFRSYWTSTFPMMTSALMVLWALWRSGELSVLAVLMIGACMAFFVSLQLPISLSRIVPITVVVTFLVAEALVPVRLVEVALLSCSIGVFGAFYRLQLQGKRDKRDKSSELI
jgi:hypothetical protein